MGDGIPPSGVREDIVFNTARHSFADNGISGESSAHLSSIFLLVFPLSILLGRKNANPHKRLERVHRRRVGDHKDVVSTKRSTKKPNKHQAIKQINPFIHPKRSSTHETNQQKLLLV